MNTNRILLALGVLSMLLVTMAVSYPRTNASLPIGQGASDFYQRHPAWTWASRDTTTDYFQRHPELSVTASAPLAASDYFMRHPELTISVAASADLTDYFFRQAALSASGKTIDLTDYFFRHP
jgi:hypothetical protein